MCRALKQVQDKQESGASASTESMQKAARGNQPRPR